MSENRVVSPSVPSLIQTDRTIVKDMAQSFIVLTERTASIGPFPPAFSVLVVHSDCLSSFDSSAFLVRLSARVIVFFKYNLKGLS